MAFFQNLGQQFKALMKLPSQIRHSTQSQTQAKAIQDRLNTAIPQIPQIQPRVQPQAQEIQADIQPPIPQPQPQNQAQIDAINKGLEELTTGLQALAKTLPQQAAEVQQKKETPFEETPAGKRLAALENEILKGQQITPEEETTDKQLANLLASKELGLRAIEEKPIAMEFITGQKAALERRAATQAIPLQARLAQLQAKRQAALDVAKTKLGFEKTRLEREEKERMAKLPDEEKVDEYINEQGQKVVAFRNKRTGIIRQEILGKIQPKERETTQTERDRVIKTEVIKRARPILMASRGRDGYVSPVKYLDLRQQYAEAVGDPKDFDDIFSPMLSPQERARLFSLKSVPQATIKGIKGTEEIRNPFE